VAQLRQWVGQLGDPAAEVRESARSALLNLRRDDLPSLRRVADTQQPLLPGQLLALREVVTEVFLASEPYDVNSDHGMLGLRWPEAAEDSPVTFDVGIVVDERIPGFCAFRMLRPGDVIVKLLDQPKVDLHSLDNFMGVVSLMNAGQTLRVRVLRNGQSIDMSLVLDPRPSEIKPNELDDTDLWLRDRNDKAEQYWNDNFGSLEQPVPSTTHATTRQ
jgi:hypothetical protein